MTVGNVVGSNSFTIGIILGLTALVCPIPVNRQIIRIDTPIALGVALLLPLVLLNQSLGRIEGVLLLAGIVVYIRVSGAPGRRGAAHDQGGVSVPAVSRHSGIDLAFIPGGFGILVLGSRLLVDHSVSLARRFGISEAVIGLTIVAAGTSMPELATSLVAA